MINEPPTEEVIKMKKDKMEHDDIIKNLEEKGYNHQQISEAINQADIKSGVETKSTGLMQESMLSSEKEEEIPVPTPSKIQETETTFKTIRPTQQMPQFIPPSQIQYNYEDIQEITESIVKEKWQQLISSVGDLSMWKSKTEDDISAIKQEILRVEERLDNLQRSIIGKVDEYNKNISKVNTEVQALEKVFQKIMQPFTQNVKELSRLTRYLKESTSQTKIATKK
jgi:uncharacterized protein YukE